MWSFLLNSDRSKLKSFIYCAEDTKRLNSLKIKKKQALFPYRVFKNLSNKHHLVQNLFKNVLFRRLSKIRRSTWTLDRWVNANLKFYWLKVSVLTVSCFRLSVSSKYTFLKYLTKNSYAWMLLMCLNFLFKSFRHNSIWVEWVINESFESTQSYSFVTVSHASAISSALKISLPLISFSS